MAALGSFAAGDDPTVTASFNAPLTSSHGGQRHDDSPITLAAPAPQAALPTPVVAALHGPW